MDTAIPKQEVYVVSAQPEEMVPEVNVLTEVVGNEADASMDRGVWVDGIKAQSEETRERFTASDSESGVFAELWTSIREDIFGPKGKVAL